MGVVMLIVGAALMIGPLFLPIIGFLGKAILGVAGLVAVFDRPGHHGLDLAV